jgi:hypothetical protein
LSLKTGKEGIVVFEDNRFDRKYYSQVRAENVCRQGEKTRRSRI